MFSFSDDDTSSRSSPPKKLCAPQTEKSGTPSISSVVMNAGSYMKKSELLVPLQEEKIKIVFVLVPASGPVKFVCTSGTDGKVLLELDYFFFI